MTLPQPSQLPLSLDEVRRAIDGVDDAILALLQKRMALVDGVIAAKAGDNQPPATPLRPSREMSILKRLIAGRGELAPELLVRLWRGVMCEATLKQGAVTLHISRKLGQTMGHRLRIRDHFGRFAVEEWKDAAQALMQVNANPADICLVEPDSDWIDAYLEGRAGKAHVIAALPALKDSDIPKLLVLAASPVQATGEDETLLISKGSLPRDFSMQPIWQLKVGPYRLSSIAGWLSEHESPLISLSRSNPGLGLKVAGRYASAIEI